MNNFPEKPKDLKISQPMDVIEKLRELVKPMGYEIDGFSWGGNSIKLELGIPNENPYTVMNPAQKPPYLKAKNV